jgi:rRNA biogenesis protein RRP5
MYLNFLSPMYSQNISPGMKLWGVIAEVNEKDLVIGLPGGLRGLVRMPDAFDPDVKSEIAVV